MATVNNDLTAWIEERIDADSTLDDAVGLLVLAALEGEDELDDYLRRGASARRDDAHRPDEAAVPATGAFLRSLQVTGFRGIGPTATLTLEPVPGLTVVAGRNGSGKSSIAEGLEMVLTGGTYRWKNKKSTQWSERWRNVHHDGDTQVTAEMIEEGAGPIVVRTRWATDTADVNNHVTTAQRTANGTKGPNQDVAALGWGPSLETYRPMLSYDELGGLLEAGPSELYDAIAKVLGTEQLAEALAHIKARLGQLTAPQKTAAAERRTLQTEADGLDDERAQAVAPLLKKTVPDTTAIRDLATGVTQPDRVVASLRALSQLQTPDPGHVSTAAEQLRAAVTGMAEAGEAEAARRVARLDIRRQALRLHAQHGEQTCPVCNQGTLDDAWLQTSRDLVAHEEAELQELSDARAELAAARQALRALAQRRPATTDRAPVEEVATALADLRTTWNDSSPPPTATWHWRTTSQLHAEELATKAGTVRAAASAALGERDDAWGPLAGRIAAWCGPGSRCSRTSRPSTSSPPQRSGSRRTTPD